MKLILPNIMIALIILLSAALSQAVEPVYFVQNQQYVEFGGVFDLVTYNGNTTIPNIEGFQLAEAFSCAVQQVKEAGLWEGAQVRAHIRAIPNSAKNMYSLVQEFGVSNIVMPVFASGVDELNDFGNAMRSYKAAVLPYVRPGELTKGLVNKAKDWNLLFTGGNDAHQASALWFVIEKFAFSKLAVVYEANDNSELMKEAVARLYSNTTSLPTITCTLDWESASQDLTVFKSCVDNALVLGMVIFSSRDSAGAILTSLNSAAVINNKMRLFVPSSIADTGVFESLIDQGFPSDILESTLAIQSYQGTKDILRQCLAKRTYNAFNEPYDFFNENFAAFHDCSIGSGDKRCITDPNINLTDLPLTSPGINFVFDSVLLTASIYHEFVAECGTLAVKMQWDPQVLCAKFGVLDASRILEILKKKTVDGLTGPLRWTSAFRRQMVHNIMQFREGLWVQVGEWTSGTSVIQLYADDDDVLYSSAASGKLANFKDSDAFVGTPWTDPLAIVVIVLTSFGLLGTIAATYFVFRYKNSSVIKRASPLFCFVMLFGIGLLYLQLYLWMGVQTQSMCIAKVWLPFLGFSLIMGPLLAKTFRIWKIFDNHRLKSRRLLDSHLMAISAGFVSINVLVLIAWTAVDPIHPMFPDTNSPGRCLGDNDQAQFIIFLVFTIYNSLLLLGGSFLSYKTRSVESSFNESAYIAYTLYAITFCMALLLPIYKTLEGRSGMSASTTFFIRSIAILFANTCCLMILFGPKVYHVYKRTNDPFGTSSTILPGTAQTPKFGKSSEKPATSTPKATHTAPAKTQFKKEPGATIMADSIIQYQSVDEKGAASVQPIPDT